MPELGLRTISENWDIRNAAHEVLLQEGGSLHRNIILERMSQLGVTVVGKTPTNNLTAQMCRDARLISRGRGIWDIRQREK